MSARHAVASARVGRYRLSEGERRCGAEPGVGPIQQVIGAAVRSDACATTPASCRRMSMSSGLGGTMPRGVGGDRSVRGPDAVTGAPSPGVARTSRTSIGVSHSLHTTTACISVAGRVMEHERRAFRRGDEEPAKERDPHRAVDPAGPVPFRAQMPAPRMSPMMNSHQPPAISEDRPPLNPDHERAMIAGRRHVPGPAHSDPATTN